MSSANLATIYPTMAPRGPNATEVRIVIAEGVVPEPMLRITGRVHVDFYSYALVSGISHGPRSKKGKEIPNCVQNRRIVPAICLIIFWAVASRTFVGCKPYAKTDVLDKPPSPSPVELSETR